MYRSHFNSNSNQQLLIIHELPNHIISQMVQYKIGTLKINIYFFFYINFIHNSQV